MDCNTIAENMIASVYQAGTTNGPGFASVLLSFFSSAVMGVQAAFISNSSTIVRASLRSKSANGYSPWSDFLMSGRVGDGMSEAQAVPVVERPALILICGAIGWNWLLPGSCPPLDWKYSSGTKRLFQYWREHCMPARP